MGVGKNTICAYQTSKNEDEGNNREISLTTNNDQRPGSINDNMNVQTDLVYTLYSGYKRANGAIVPASQEKRPAKSAELKVFLDFAGLGVDILLNRRVLLVPFGRRVAIWSSGRSQYVL